MKVIRSFYILSIFVPVSVGATCIDNVISDHVDVQYVINEDVVTDAKTGLMWSRCSLGQTYSNGDCIGIASDLTYEEALNKSVTFRVGGYEDWRLPNIKELGSIVHRGCFAPSINERAFPDTPSNPYYSNTPYDAATPYIINFADGTELLDITIKVRNIRFVRTVNLISANNGGG